MVNTRFSHDELCIKAVNFMKNNGFGVVFHDKFQAALSSGEKPDAIGFRNGTSCLIEVKCSRSDFLADKKKHFRANPENGIGDWRFYMCEPDIISITDLPKGWGLLHVKGKQVIKVHGFPSNTQWYSRKPFISDKQAECDYLYSALRRITKHGHFLDIYK